MKRTPLKRTGFLRRKTKLKAMSRKRAKELRTYFQIRKEYLEKNPWCEAGPVILVAKLPDFYAVPTCSIVATEIHHTKRRGPHLNDQDTFCGCCHNCHRWIETHATKSRELGLLI